MIVDVDREGFRQIAAALRPYRERLEHNGGAVAPAFEFVESLARFCVREGQAGSSFDTSARASDSEAMTPIAVTYRDAAERLSVSEATIKREVRNGRIRVIRIGHAARIRVADLDAYANQLAQAERPGEASTSPAGGNQLGRIAGTKAASDSPSRDDLPAPTPLVPRDCPRGPRGERHQPFDATPTGA